MTSNIVKDTVCSNDNSKGVPYKMIWIIGGTSESRRLINRIKDLNNYIVTVATESGEEFFQGTRFYMGRMDYDDMLDFVSKNHISIIVDLSHPYAKVVTENARKVAKEKNIKYIRYIRNKVIHNSKGIYLKSYEETYDYIAKIKGTVFFTTGSKNIGDFEKVRGENRFIYRILPALESIKICKKNDIKLKDIVAVLGPFSVEYNKIMFNEYDADYVVMKDSGKEGGTLDKIRACEELAITPIIIGRKTEDGFHSLDSIEKIIRGDF